MSSNTVAEMFRRMSFGASPDILFFTIISSVIVAVAGYFWFVVEDLKIPMTLGLVEIATLLPALNYIAVKYLVKPPKGQPRGNPGWSLQTGIISIIMVMLDTFVMTQASNNIPLSSITCPLEKTWHEFYSAKDANSIRSLQDKMNCCGLKKPQDLAWPFQKTTNREIIVPATKCMEIYDRKTPCFIPWSQKHQLAAGMFVGVAVVTLLSKVIIFAVYRRRARKSTSTQRLIGPGTISGAENGAENGAGQISGLRLRADERIRFPENEDEDVESVVDESSRLLEDNDRNSQYTQRQLESNVPILPSGDDSIWQTERSRTNSSR